MWIKHQSDGTVLYDNHTANPEPSNVKFLTVEFQQDGMKKHIRVKKGEYMVGNNLFTPLFLMNYAHLDNSAWIPWVPDLDMPYNVSLIDNKMKTTILKRNQFIVLHKTHYVVMEKSED